MANSDETTIDDFLVISDTLETATSNKDVLTLNARVKLVFVNSFFYSQDLFVHSFLILNCFLHIWNKYHASSTDKIVPLCDPSYAWIKLLSWYLAQPSSTEVSLGFQALQRSACQLFL